MGYYSENLAGERLRRCYEIAPPRVKQYLRSEIEHVLSRIEPGDSVLELGCGYGRVARELARAAGRAVGIDTAAESIDLAISSLPPGLACEFLKMDAVGLGFADDEFDRARGRNQHLFHCAQLTLAHNGGHGRADADEL